MQEEIKIIGMDCATEVQKIGLAMGVYNNSSISLLETKLGSDGSSVTEIIANWTKYDEKVVFAIDAPLGWPEDLGNSLYHHTAGQPLAAEANMLYRRETDRFIKKTLGKQPLDVGADRIARTTHVALRIIDELRIYLKSKIEMAWNSDKIDGISVIEVYPAATLQCYGIRNTRYKEKGQRAEREEILKGLERIMTIKCDTQYMIQSADVLDSAVCIIAAKNFIDGNVYFPDDIERAKKEGWIWIKK